MTRPTVVVVGAYGSAGAAVAERLADEDVHLVLVDDGEPGGGLCILRGCMPSKEVLSVAAHRFQARKDERLRGAPPEVDLDATVERKDGHVLSWAEHRREAVHSLAERPNVEFVHDRARIRDGRRVEVDGRSYDADHLVLATGSRLNVPDLPGLEDVDYLSSADVLDARELGDTGVVMGFGTVGLELAPYLSECGVDLTVVEHDDAPLDEADPEFGGRVLEMYREEFGLEVVTNARERRVEPAGDGVRLYLDVEGEERVVEADDLYLFTGRRPTLPEGVGRVAEPGPGWVEDTMRTADDPRTYVVGDANGMTPILHVAKEEGFTAADNVLAAEAGEPPRSYEPLNHKVVFSGLGIYPYAVLGLTEREARDRGVDHVAVTREASDDGVFRSKHAAHGLAKLVVARDGEVLGYQGLHLHADVMAKTMQVVLESRMDVRDVPDRAYHPTTPELIDGLLREAKQALEDRVDS